MEFLKFIFSNFWTFIGFFLVLCVAATVVKSLLDFVVELIHGKPTIQNITLDKDTKVELPTKKEKKDKPLKDTQDVSSGASISGGDVSVRRN